jgi:hypothetical protein
MAVGWKASSCLECFVHTIQEFCCTALAFAMIDEGKCFGLFLGGS